MSNRITWKVLTKEGILFMRFINYTLSQSRVLQGIYFILVESCQASRKDLFFHFKCSVRMNTFCHTVCCI